MFTMRWAPSWMLRENEQDTLLTCDLQSRDKIKKIKTHR